MNLSRKIGAALRPTLAALALATAGTGCQAENDDALAVVISLPEQYVAGAAKATVQVDYTSTGARLLHEGGAPACAFILPGFEGDFSDDGRGTLTIRTRGGRSLRGPADIAACRMDAGEDVTPAGVQRKLVVEVTAAEDAEGKALSLTASRSASHRRGKAGGSDAAAVREAQQAAVRAAANLSPTRVASAPAATASGPSSTANKSAAAPPRASAPLPPSSPGAAAAAAAAAAQKAAARKSGAATSNSASNGIVRNPAAASPEAGSAPVDDDPVPLEDTDPDYDDSPSDDETAPAYTLEFSVAGSGRYGALQFIVNHLGRSGGFIGRKDAVDCVSMVEALVAANYVGERVTNIGLISLQGIPTPAKIMRCGFRTRESLSPASFLIQVTDASDTDSNQIDPPPTVVISTISRR